MRFSLASAVLNSLKIFLVYQYSLTTGKTIVPSVPVVELERLVVFSSGGVLFGKVTQGDVGGTG